MLGSSATNHQLQYSPCCSHRAMCKTLPSISQHFAGLSQTPRLTHAVPGRTLPSGETALPSRIPASICATRANKHPLINKRKKTRSMNPTGEHITKSIRPNGIFITALHSFYTLIISSLTTNYMLKCYLFRFVNTKPSSVSFYLLFLKYVWPDNSFVLTNRK